MASPSHVRSTPLTATKCEADDATIVPFLATCQKIMLIVVVETIRLKDDLPRDLLV